MKKSLYKHFNLEDILYIARSVELYHETTDKETFFYEDINFAG